VLTYQRNHIELDKIQTIEDETLKIVLQSKHTHHLRLDAGCIDSELCKCNIYKPQGMIRINIKWKRSRQTAEINGLEITLLL
jgi:hypothetical protein